MSDEGDEHNAEKAKFCPHIVKDPCHNHPSQGKRIETEVGEDVGKDLDSVSEFVERPPFFLLEQGDEEDEAEAEEDHVLAKDVGGRFRNPSEVIDERGGVDVGGEKEVAANHKDDPSYACGVTGKVADEGEGEVDEADEQGEFEEDRVVKVGEGV